MEGREERGFRRGPYINKAQPGTLLSLSDQRVPQEVSRVLPKPDKHALTLLT